MVPGAFHEHSSLEFELGGVLEMVILSASRHQSLLLIKKIIKGGENPNDFK